MIELSTEAQALEGVATALRFEEDGRQLRKDMTRELRQAVEPAIPVIKSGLMSYSGAGRVSPSLTATVASRVRVASRLTGDRAGVRVSIGRTGMPRGFRNAPKRLNRAEGWRHPVFGDTEKWVQQRGPAGYFDDPLNERRDEMRAAVVRAVEEMSERVARRAGRG